MKEKIPKALREQVWVRKVGRTFNAKCKIPWCQNQMTVFDFQCGHDIPESKGGPTSLENLVPICSRCNLSMSNVYTIQQWSRMGQPLPWWKRYLCSMRSVTTENGIQSPPKRTNQNAKPSKSRGG